MRLLTSLHDILWAIPPLAWLSLPVLIALFSLTQALLARRMGVQVHLLQLGYGPPLLRTRLGSLPVQVGPLPLGAFVKMATRHDDDEEDEGTGGGLRYEALSPLQQLALQLSGPLVLALLGLVGGGGVGQIALLLAAANLFPTPGTAGGQALIVLIEAGWGRSLPVGLLAAWSGLGALAFLGLVVGVLLSG